MNKYIKIISTLLMVILLVATISNVVMATGAQGALSRLNPTQSDATNKVETLGNKIIGIITSVAAVAAIIVILVLGVKYMMGSASEKAEYKKVMIPYLVGAVLVFGASALVKAIASASASIV